jgi:hypothetical protein
MFKKFFCICPVPRLTPSLAIHEVYRSQNAATATQKYFWVDFHPTSQRQTFGNIFSGLGK